MKHFDFCNHQNRLLRWEDVDQEYLDYIRQTTREDAWYPKYHIAPAHGLLNDPNGLCVLHGVYHIFYQWFPFGPVHGLKHWYHISTKDFVHYQDHGVALAPEDSFDYHGCYSGMCLQEAKHSYMYYTGIDEQDHANVCYGEFIQNTIVKKGVLLPLDEQITTANFRDPYVWQSGDNKWMMVGGEAKEHKGILPLYKAAANQTFVYQGNLNMLDYPFGYMLECPNYFETAGKGVLFFSPQGIQSTNRFDFRNVFSVVYMIGNPIVDTTFDAVSFYEMDKGFDFYAPQIFKDEQGRYLLYGWLGNSKCTYPSDKNNWAHMLTIPRKVSIEEDRIIQQPLEELKALRIQTWDKVEHLYLDDLACEIAIETDAPFAFFIENEQKEYLRFTMQKEEYQLDRGHTTYKYNEAYGMIRYAQRLVKEKQTIRIFIDHSSIEIFADHGKTVFTGRFYLHQAHILRFVSVQGTVWRLQGNIMHKEQKIDKQSMK